jgi:hypothetical protein
VEIFGWTPKERTARQNGVVANSPIQFVRNGLVAITVPDDGHGINLQFK